MSDLKNILKDIGYFGIGAAAVILESGSKAVKCLVRKGAKIIEDNQDTVDEMKQKAREAGARIKEAVQDLSRSNEASVVEEPTVVEIEAEEAVPVEDTPVTPDVIYRTAGLAPVEEPAPPAAPAPTSSETPEPPAAPEEERRPEETANG